MIAHERLRSITLAEVGSGEEALRILPARSGLPVRVVRDVLRRDGAVTFELAGALLTAVDAAWRWHVDPPFGLSDVYESGAGALVTSPRYEQLALFALEEIA